MCVDFINHNGMCPSLKMILTYVGDRRSIQMLDRNTSHPSKHGLATAGLPRPGVASDPDPDL